MNGTNTNSQRRISQVENKYYKTQLCWTCARACGGCSWSANFQPVKGWTATKTIMNVDRGAYEKRRIKTYKIRACPLYVCDTKQPEQPQAHFKRIPIVKRPKHPCVMRGTQRERIWALPDLKERIARLTGELKLAAELTFIYNYNGVDAAEVMRYSESGYKRILFRAMNEIEVMA